ncbi:MAG: DUF6471 domain-containing protein [Erythrobacter sp.]
MKEDHAPESPDIPSEKSWEELAKNLVRAEMMRRGVSFATLPDLLAKIGVTDNETNLRNKVGRGRFTIVFFLQCMKALGVEWIQIPESIEEGAQKGGAQVLARKSRKPQEPGQPE